MSLIVGLIIAAVAAFFVYQDASKRNMNAVLWAVGVFLFLIIFLPLYFIMRKPVVTALPPPVDF